MLMGEGCDIVSDGGWNNRDEWLPARHLVEKVFPGEAFQCPWGKEADTEEEEDDGSSVSSYSR